MCQDLSRRRTVSPALVIVAAVLGGPPGCSRATPPTIPASARVQAANLYHQAALVWPYTSPGDMVKQFYQRHEDPAQVLAALNLEPGMTVADIGSGVGFYTFKLARAVGPTGRVLALDVQEQTLLALRQRATHAELNPYDNVEPRLSSVDATGLEPGSADVALMAHLDFYLSEHLLPESERMLRSTLDSLAPGARLVVVQLILPGTRPDHLARNFRSVGFRERRSENLREKGSWLFVFERPAEARGDRP